MECLEPELQQTYDKCKYIVKVWEYKFQKKYKRVPSKLDIKEASRDVRNAYRKYFQLKTAILDQSFKGIEGFDDLEDEDEIDRNENSSNLELQTQIHSDNNDFIFIEPTKDNLPTILEENNTTPIENLNISEKIWGTHLNNEKDEQKPQEQGPKPNLNLNISKKLFCGSKFTKRNPRKSLTLSQKNKTDTDNKVTLSQPSPSFTSFSSEEAINLLQNDILDKPFKTVSHFEGSLSQPMNLVQTFFDHNHPRPLKTVDAGWLKRVAQITGTSQENPELTLTQQSIEDQPEFTKLDYDSDDIIENSDEEESFKSSQPLHVAKKRKIENQNVPNNLIHESVRSVEDSVKPSDVKEDNQISLKVINEVGKEDFKELVLEDKTKSLNEDLVDVPETGEDCLNEKFKDTLKDKKYKITNAATKNTPRKTTTRKSPKTNVLLQDTAKNKPAEETSNTFDTVKRMNKTKRTPKKSKEPKTPKKSKEPKTPKKSKEPKTPKKSKEPKTPKNTKPSPSQISERRSSRKTKVKVNLKEFSSDEELFYTDTDERDPEFTLTDNKKKQNEPFTSDEESTPKKSPKVTKKRTLKSTGKKRVKKIQEIDDTEEDTQPYDLEFSVKPRIVAPRFGNVKEVLRKNKNQTKMKESVAADSENSDEKALIKDRRQQARDKLEKKITSGSLNDNFVRIDIRKKVFVRGKIGKNFSKYKKSQWKKAKALTGPDMDMGGCDGGMLSCFNCGQVGHFARYCPAKKGDNLLALNAADEEEECAFPTLEEASKMAEEGNLNVRKPKVALKEIQNSESNDVINDNEETDDLFDDDIDSEQLLLETLKLEEYIKKLDVQMYIDNVKVVEPYYKLNEDNSLIETPQEVFEVLEKFGHSSFRPGQEQAIMRILSGKSTLVTLSTGSGKSLCYQLPAYLYSQREPCISLIISPLVSLMDDQVLGIAKFLKAACLHSNQTSAQRKKILEAISLGELSVLLVSPEAVVSGEKQRGFSSFLRKLPPIAFACIDEAHCVSQWSHNFRPSYLMICRVLRDSLGIKTILGLTATATKATQSSIIKHLQIPDGEDGVISDIPLPDNLQLSVSKEPIRDHALLNLLLSDRFKECNSIIVYCTRRQECERIAGFLRTSLKYEQPVKETNKKRKRVHLQAEPYHAGLAASRRRTIQNAFMSGELKIVVATVAFGMGINKSDIRSVIHYNMPSSFESYVQEVGRAGRDGLNAHCHVFLDSLGRDENELRRHIHSNSIDRHVIRKLLEKVFIPCSCKEQCLKHEVAFSIESTVRALDIPEENISTLLCYLELHENKYIELLSPGYTKCKVVSYCGPMQIRKMAKECPPLAMALALHKNEETKDANILEFPVVDVAAAMGWESGICKFKLKNLEWTTVNGQQKRSPLNIQFFDLGFRLLAPGNLSGDQLDDALDSLYNRVVEQGKTALLQLNAIHQTLSQVAKASFQTSSSTESDQLVKSRVREYFNSPNPLKLVSEIEYPKFSEEQLISDIRALILMYRDNTFTARAVARIFQGIPSPNYPAVVWGRCKFWRSHLDKDFHVIVRTATKEIIKLR